MFGEIGIIFSITPHWMFYDYLANHVRNLRGQIDESHDFHAKEEESSIMSKTTKIHHTCYIVICPPPPGAVPTYLLKSDQVPM
jgi:hypothetical protein